MRFVRLPGFLPDVLPISCLLFMDVKSFLLLRKTYTFFFRNCLIHLPFIIFIGQP